MARGISKARRGGMGWIRLSTRMAIYHRDGFDCVYCRLVFPVDPLGYGLTLDHVVPGAGNGPNNLVTACPGCNYGKGDSPLNYALRRAAERALAKPLDRTEGRRLAAIRKAQRQPRA